MWHKNLHRLTNSFPLKCPGSSNTLCPLFLFSPLFLLSRMWIPEGHLTFEHCVKIAAPEVTVAVRLLIGRWEGLAFWFRTQAKKTRHHRTSGFAHICKKNAIFHLRQGLKLCFPLFGKNPLKRSHFSKAPVFTLFLNISCEAFDCKIKAIWSFRFRF